MTEAQELTTLRREVGRLQRITKQLADKTSQPLQRYIDGAEAALTFALDKIDKRLAEIAAVKGAK